MKTSTFVLAGITVTAYLVPQCLAYADLAGVQPITGLWVAVVAMIAYALLGTSRQLSVGPESATAILVAAAIAPLAGGDEARYIALAAGLALLVGGVCIAAFVLRLGFLADLLSQPILVGYMAGVALIMIGSQLSTITGVTLTETGTIARVVELWGKAGEIQPAAVALGLLLYLRLTRHAQRYQVVTGKGFRPRTVQLGRWRWLATAIVLLSAILMLLPMLALAWTSLFTFITPPSLAALAMIAWAVARTSSGSTNRSRSRAMRGVADRPPPTRTAKPSRSVPSGPGCRAPVNEMQLISGALH